MSTSKHIDKICIAAVAIALIVSFLLVMISPSQTVSAGVEMEYEGTIFDTSYVHEINIEMDDWDSFIESCEDEEYTVCTLTIDGTLYENVAIRAKGNTSLSNVSSLGSERYSFKIEFDHYQNGETLDGLDKLCLNNLIQDNTMMKDYLVYTMMREFGADSPLCSFSYLTVNDEDWGLYLAVEGIEESFLERNYGEDYGNLYKPDSMSFGGGRGNGKGFDMDEFSEKFNTEESDSESMPDMSNIQMPDGESMPDMSDIELPDGESMPDMSDMEMPEGNETGGMETGGGQGGGMEAGGGQGGGMGDNSQGSDDVKLKYIDDNVSSYSNIFDNAKTNPDGEDKNILINSLKNLSNYENLEETLDIEEVLRYFVVHNFVCNGDSYTGSMIHNYYLYEEDGQLSMIPWDYNLAFGTFQGNDASGSVNTSIDNPLSSGSLDDRPMLGWIFSDSEYTDEYHALFADFIKEWFSDGKLSKLIDATAEMIAPYVESDPTKFCTYDEFEAGVETIKEYVELRAEAVTNQLAGNDTEVDTGDLDLSLMGTMNSGMGGQGGGMDDQGAGMGGQGADTLEMPSGDATQEGQMPGSSGDSSEMPSGDATQEGQMPSGDIGQGAQGGGRMQGGGGGQAGGMMPGQNTTS